MSQLILTMRKSRLFAAAGAIALMLASCSADEPVAQNTTEGAINYAVVADNQTRAANSYCNNNLPKEFNIWATHTAVNNTTTTDYISGDEIKEVDGNYTDVTGARYWPREGTLSFYAVVDGDGKATQDPTSGKIVVNEYEIKENVNNQLDLMYAVTADVSKTDDNNGNVMLNFRHALSQICFKARNENPNIRITINSITVNNVKNKGTYILPDQSTTDNINDHNNIEKPNDPKRGEWTANTLEGSASYTINFTTKNQLDGIATLDLTCCDNEEHHTPNWYAQALNLLPQEWKIKDSNTDSDPHFTLSLNIENIDENGTEIATPSDLEIFTNINWEQGNRYIYTFIFPNNWKANGAAIGYNVTVDDFLWRTDDETLIEIGGHQAVKMRNAKGGEPALYFATTNIGADTPYESGKYFWWGDIHGYNLSKNGDGKYVAIDKENSDENFLFIDNNNVIETNDMSNEEIKEKYLKDDENLNDEHDAARQHWGELWRMPTKEELEWLINENNCKWKYIKKNVGFSYYEVTSKETGGVIYLPAASCFEGKEGETYYTPTPPSPSNPDDTKYDNTCFYWSATIGKGPNNEGKNYNRAYRLKVNEEKKCKEVKDEGRGYDGFPIRPVVSL